MGEAPYTELKIHVPDSEGFLTRLLKGIWGAGGAEPGGEPQEKQETVSEPEDLPEEDNMDHPGAMSLVKSASGKWLWFARYSNKYLDNDYPREIISEESHLNFVKEVNEGNQELPELWLHHIPGTAWGKAQWVGYSDGFAMASGYVYPGHEDLAESLAQKSGLLLSHGMAPESIVRDEQNPNIILRHVTKEISPLPAERAANKLTGFVILEEDNMKEKGLSADDRKTLIDMGVPEEWVNRQEEANKTLARIADELDLPSKAATQEEEEVEEVEGAGADVEVEEEVEETADETAKPAVDEEMIDAIVESIKSLSDRVDAIASYVKSIKETQDNLVGDSTKATRMGILKSVIGADETQIDGRTSLAKSAPKETTSNSQSPFFFQKEGWTNGS